MSRAWRDKPVTCIGLTDDQHAARVRQARADIMAVIMAEHGDVVASVRVLDDGIWVAHGKDGFEICRAQSGAGLRALLPFAGI